MHLIISPSRPNTYYLTVLSLNKINCRREFKRSELATKVYEFSPKELKIEVSKSIDLIIKLL